MKIWIDFSIFISTPVSTDAFGMASGDIDWPHIPAVGEAVDVLQGKKLPRDIPGFTGVLKVDAILPSGDSVLLMLEDLMLQSREDAELLRDFLDRETGLLSLDWKRDLE